MTKPTPMTDDEIEQAVYSVTRNIPSIQDCRAIEAARDAQWEAMLKQEPVAWMNSKRDMTYLHGPYNSDDIPLYEAQPAQQEPCDMGEMCLGCTPRNQDGSCPGIKDNGVCDCYQQGFSDGLKEVEQPAQQGKETAATLTSDEGKLRQALANLIAVTKHLNPCPATLQAAKEALHEQS